MFPFELQIFKRKINIYLIDNTKKLNFEMILDWKIYELILFNIIQNSIKYNKENGEILIICSCKSLKNFIDSKNNYNYML